jgi:asparagine synthase (glutamine-hydrolysing)
MLLALGLDRVAGGLRRVFSPRLLAHLPGAGDPKALPARFRRFMLGLSRPPLERYLRWIAIFSGGEKEGLLAPEFARAAAGAAPLDFLRGPWAECGELGALARLPYVDTMTYLPCDINQKVDIASMACSLETRSPFLDHKLVELAARIPIEHRLRLTRRGLEGKLILKRAFASDVPGEILGRRKMGFGVPITQWFRGELRELARDTLEGARTVEAGWFRAEAVARLLGEHESGRADHGYRLWSLLMLELWYRRFVEGEGAAV